MEPGSPDGFGARLRQERLTAGLSQEELAARAGLNTRTVSNLERGVTGQPYLRTIARLAAALGLDERGRARLAGQPAAPGGSPAAAAGQPAAVIPRQLPAAVKQFTGRGQELRWLTRFLDGRQGGSGGTTLISAVGGTAGVGKTALAVHWAHQAAGRFPDGQFYVNLRGYDPGQPVPPGDALAGFLRALGVPGSDIPPDTSERAGLYRSLLAGRRLLVVLDNAGSVEQVRPLLPGAPACMTLVTSRDALAGLVARDGAHRLDLALLPTAEATALLTGLIGERATADPDAVTVLAQRCARLPLALRVAAELATSRPAEPLAALTRELDDQNRRLALLDADGDPATAVRGVFSWSVRRLPAATARTFRLLGLHPGPEADQYAVAALTGTGAAAAEQALAQLARAYLAEPGTDRSPGTPTRPEQYRLHDLLRDYARELAAARDGPAATHAALTQLFDYYLATAAAAMDTLFPAERHRRPRVPPPAPGAAPPVDTPAAARAWLNASRATLTAIVSYTATQGWPHHATRLAATLFRDLLGGGHCPEALTVHEHALIAARHDGDRGAEGTALTNLGITEAGQGRYDQAAQRYGQALTLFRAAGDRAGEARVLTNLGVCEQWRGRLGQASHYYGRSLALFRETSDRAGEARALSSLGMASGMQGRYAEASGWFQDALALTRATGDGLAEAQALVNLGILKAWLGRHGEAWEHYARALPLFRVIGDHSGEALALAGLGQVEHCRGRYDRARLYLRESLVLRSRAGDRRSVAVSQNLLGILERDAGHPERALIWHRRAMSFFRETGNLDGQSKVLVLLGDVSLATGQPGQARRQHGTALRLARQTGSLDEQAHALDGVGRACLMQGDPAQARRYWQRSLDIYTRLGAPEAAEVRARLEAAAAGPADSPAGRVS